MTAAWPKQPYLRFVVDYVCVNGCETLQARQSRYKYEKHDRWSEGGLYDVTLPAWSWGISENGAVSTAGSVRLDTGDDRA